VSFAGPQRVNDPGIAFEALPLINAVLVSHCHYDHLDLPTLSRLAAAHRTARDHAASATMPSCAATIRRSPPKPTIGADRVPLRGAQA